jgi:hypothetical protein
MTMEDQHRPAGDHTPALGPYDALTGRELTDDEIRAAQVALMEQAQHRIMEGHAERVAAFERTRPQGKRRPGKPHRMRQDLTGRQRHKRAYGAAMLDLEDRLKASGLYVGIQLSRRTWCARLRELELHPERHEAIKARYTPAQLASREVGSGA